MSLTTAVRHCYRLRFSYLVSVWLASCLMAMPLHAENKLSVFVSVLPQQYFVERIAGDIADTRVMVKPGYSPATYEPSPRQISTLAKADLYFSIGVPFEAAWLERIQSVNPDIQITDMRTGVRLLELDDHDHHHAHDHSGEETTKSHAESSEEHRTEDVTLDPHIWTSPRIAIGMAAQIKNQLVKLRPTHESALTANHNKLKAELEALDQELTALFNTHTQKKFMVFHPSWGYFANDYGLTQIAIEAEGKEPGARALAALIKQAKKEQVKTIFVQPQFDTRAAKQVARAIDGKVVAIDPLAENYIENLRKTARLIAGVGDE